MKVIVVVLTRNAGKQITPLVVLLLKQGMQSSSIIVIDSSSEDDTVELAKKLGVTSIVISKDDFNHGATRQLALSVFPVADIIIYMTQDAILASPDSIKNILAPFEDEKVGAVCGRQLPQVDASPIAAHARLFNYPAESSIKSKEDIPRLGIKAAFLSDSFAAYRRTALMDVGGFPSDVIFGEDTYIAAKMLQNGWKVAYAAQATCYHSHNYSFIEEFDRYFDIGVFHSREKWFIESLGKAEGEGKKFVISELKYLVKQAPWLIPSAILRTAIKLIGYRIGQMESILPIQIKKHLSMNKRYWEKS